jgi:shikimate dehydrogenase
MKRFAVFGQPVLHSLSPKIHRAFAAQFGITLDYTAIECPPGDFPGALSSFAKAGGHGANVTLPHKQRAAELCKVLSERAKRAGAVNTLVKHDGGWLGDNTDGIGLVRDLTGRHGLDLRERRTLMLGAGGAARGVAPALLDAGIGALWIVTATRRKPTRSPINSATPRACTPATSTTCPNWASSISSSTRPRPRVTAACRICRCPCSARAASPWT